METSPKELVHRFLQAVNQRSPDDLAELFSEDATMDLGLPYPQPVRGREAIRSLAARYFAALSDMSMICRDVFLNHQEAVATVELVSTTSGPNPDPAVLATWDRGKRLSWRGAFHLVLNPRGEIQSTSVLTGDAELTTPSVATPSKERIPASPESR